MHMDVFLDTVNGSVPESLTTGISLADLDAVVGESADDAKVWAATNTDQNRQSYEQMNRGDAVFLYNVGESEYLGGGIIESTFETSWFVEGPWGLDYGERTLAYMFSEFKQQSMNVRDFNELLGYQPIHHPHGLQRVADSKDRSELLDAYGFPLF